MRFRDREAAGQQLAGRLSSLLDEHGIDRQTTGFQVLALPRGGVPVAGPVATELGVPLRILLVRKLGLPGHQELAMGAIAAIGDRIFPVDNLDVISAYGIDSKTLDQVLSVEKAELQRRAARFARWTAADPAGAPVVLVDDGLATGASMRAAVGSVRAAGARPVIVGIPVASRHAIRSLTDDGVLVACLTVPDPLIAVGESYRDFHQLTDDEVYAELTAAEL
jgi:putative phosphoribosyl transferase